MSKKNVQMRLERFRLPVDDDGNVIVPLDKEGNKDYGAVQRHFRIFEKHWSTEELSIRYAEALKMLLGDDVVEENEEEEAKVTARWIRMMEQKNKVPIDEKRRWIVATLLGIPAASFGLVPMEEFTERRAMTSVPGKPEKHLDVGEYTTFLRSSWELSHAIMAQDLLADIAYRTEQLRNELLYVNPQERKQMLRLLCYFHQLHANIMGDRMRLPDAIDSMNKAYRIARLLKSRELQALVLYRRGYIYFGNGYTNIAVNDWDAAAKLLPGISKPLKGAILLAAGEGHAFVAQTETDQSGFLALIDEAHNNMGTGEVDESEHFLGFDEEEYIQDRASVLTGSPIAKLRNASEASRLISKLIAPSVSLRRQASIMRIEAKIYLDRGYHKMAATLTIEALNTTTYAWNIISANTIYQHLKESKYADLQEVTDLELALLKAWQPYLFDKNKNRTGLMV